MNFFRKLKRELIVALSKVCLRSAQNDYLGLPLKYPILYGMGRGYVIPRQRLMGESLDAFLRIKDGYVIDVGVNVGLYLVKLKTLNDKTGYIGFEPNAVCSYYTNELIRLNKFKNARVLQVALSDKLDIKTLYAKKSGDPSASLISNTDDIKNYEHSSDIITVEGDSFIDMLKLDKIAVIKIDVEGSELFVLQGLEKTLEKYRPFLYVEIWAGDSADKDTIDRVGKIYDFVTSKNYKIVASNSQNKLEVINDVNEIFSQSDPNYMLVPDELLENFTKTIMSFSKSLTGTNF